MPDMSEKSSFKKPDMSYSSNKKDHYQSKSISSNQPGIHENLAKLILKHQESRYKKPYQAHNLKAFDEFIDKISTTSYQSLVLDSCCGTALSSIKLAEKYPEKLVIGIDQSAKRLCKSYSAAYKPINCHLIQSNCEDFWRLCVEQGIQFEEHYILYPNPWPKSSHLSRRWHGHPVFPYLPKLAHQTLLRSNWKLYLEEFNQAWFLLTKQKSRVDTISNNEPITLFEKKYHLSQQKLYELVLNKVNQKNNC
jgi:tRNA G46 methylase TrmB